MALVLLFITTSIFTLGTGGTLYALLFVQPKWFQNPPETFTLIHSQVSPKFWLGFYAVAALLLIATLVRTWKMRQIRWLVLGALVILVLIFVSSALYVAPQRNAFANMDSIGAFTPALQKQAQLWQVASWVKDVAFVVASGLLLTALTRIRR